MDQISKTKGKDCQTGLKTTQTQDSTTCCLMRHSLTDGKKMKKYMMQQMAYKRDGMVIQITEK